MRVSKVCPVSRGTGLASAFAERDPSSDGRPTGG
jgi:hypothetical protein